MNEPKKYVIEKVGYSSIVVSMTKREAEIIEKFLEWAVIEDDFCITPVEDYVAVDWGGWRVMRFSVAVIGFTVWCGMLTVLAKLGIKISDDTIVLSTAIVIAGALAGGGE